FRLLEKGSPEARAVSTGSSSGKKKAEELRSTSPTKEQQPGKRLQQRQELCLPALPNAGTGSRWQGPAKQPAARYQPPEANENAKVSTAYKLVQDRWKERVEEIQQKQEEDKSRRAASLLVHSQEMEKEGQVNACSQPVDGLSDTREDGSELHTSNSFYNLWQPEVTQVELLKDARSKWEVLERLYTHAPKRESEMAARKRVQRAWHKEQEECSEEEVEDDGESFQWEQMEHELGHPKPQEHVGRHRFLLCLTVLVSSKPKEQEKTPSALKNTPEAEAAEPEEGPSEVPVWQCEECDRKFKTKSSLSQHKRHVHPVRRNLERSSSLSLKDRV
ncbi:PREDICTED: uncharacterized protein LOC104571385, partial [Tinamus guttatus]|uniref:uncharacterized protein LOC104571385 n=1 Tax=Tinamus guttatus TaxID=94827 RepID=UPI00052E7B79